MHSEAFPGTPMRSEMNQRLSNHCQAPQPHLTARPGPRALAGTSLLLVTFGRLRGPLGAPSRALEPPSKSANAPRAPPRAHSNALEHHVRVSSRPLEMPASTLENHTKSKRHHFETRPCHQKQQDRDPKVPEQSPTANNWSD